MYSQLEKERLGAMSETTTLEASSHVIALQIKDLDKKIQRLDELNKELIVLERQRAADEQNYQLYLKKVEEAKVSEEMDRLKMSNISVIQAAERTSVFQLVGPNTSQAPPGRHFWCNDECRVWHLCLNT